LYEVFRPGARSADPALKPRPFRPAHEPERPATAGEREDEIVTTTTVSSSTSPPPTRRPRRTLTISTSALTVLLAGMIVLLFVAFAAGRQYESGHPSTHTPAEFTLETEAGSEAQADLAAATEPPAPAQPVADEETTLRPQRPEPEPPPPARAQVTLKKGYHYVVVQHFNKSRQQADATAAGKFLQTNGVPCARLAGADIRLVATQPFLVNQANTAAGRTERERSGRLLERIKQLGQRYNRELLKQGEKGYTFSECYLNQF
jgi:hypothetical protein